MCVKEHCRDCFWARLSSPLARVGEHGSLAMCWKGLKVADPVTE